MNPRCEHTRSLLEAWAEGTLSATERRGVVEHLASCNACAALAQALSTGLSELREPAGPDLTRWILAATSGSSCERCELQLELHRRGELDPGSSELVNEHLEHCGSCRALAQVLSWMDATLPTLRELEPDEEFTEEVLERTSRRTRRPWERWASAIRRSGAAVRRWSQGPLFPVEAAYAATLLLALLFGTEISPFQHMPQSALQWLRGESTGTQTAGPPLFTGIRTEAEKGVRRVVEPASSKVDSTRTRVFIDLELRARASWAGLRIVGGGMGDLSRAVFGDEGYEFAPSLQQIGDGFRQVWRGLRRPQEEAEVPQGP